MALGSTQPLTEMSTRSISWGQRQPVRKADNLPPSCALVTKSGNLNFMETSGHLRACNGTALLLPLALQSTIQHSQNNFNSPYFNNKPFYLTFIFICAILNKIIKAFNSYGVRATQLTTFCMLVIVIIITVTSLA